MRDEQRQRLAQLEEHFAALRDERFFEGAVRQLEVQFQNRPEWAEDAVATALERAVKSERIFPSAQDLKNWLYVVARNEMKDRARREARRPDPPWEVDREQPRSAESEALDGIVEEELYDALLDSIERWPNARRRTVGRFVLESARDYEPSTGQDIADHLADVLGTEISVVTALRLKRQALQRLKEEVAGDGLDHEERDEEEDHDE